MFSWEVVQMSLKTSVLESSEFSVAWTNVARVFTPKIRQIYSHTQKLFYNTKKFVRRKMFTFYNKKWRYLWIFHGLTVIIYAKVCKMFDIILVGREDLLVILHNTNGKKLFLTIYITWESFYFDNEITFLC